MDDQSSLPARGPRAVVAICKFVLALGICAEILAVPIGHLCSNDPWGAVDMAFWILLWGGVATFASLLVWRMTF